MYQKRRHSSAMTRRARFAAAAAVSSVSSESSVSSVSLALLLASLPLSGCGAGMLIRDAFPPKLPAMAPAGASLVLIVPEPGEYGKTDTEAETARRFVWRDVPAAWQSTSSAVTAVTAVTIESRQATEIIAIEKRDPYIPAGTPLPDSSTLTGYTSLPGHDPVNPAATTIYLSSTLWGNDSAIEPAVVHEYGHVRYWEELTDAQRASWLPVWTDALARGALPTAYAATNFDEGHAECFRCYCTGLPLDGAIRAWFDAIPH